MAVITLYLVFAMLTVLYMDATRYRIPNWLVGSLLLLYPVAAWMSPGIDWKMAICGMAIVFAVGYFVFTMRWMGGGDIKLLTVCALWVGLENLLDFIMTAALLGGALSVAILVLRNLGPHIPRPKGKELPRVLRPNEPLPYGLAIATGFLVMMWTGRVPAIL